MKKQTVLSQYFKAKPSSNSEVAGNTNMQLDENILDTQPTSQPGE